MRHPARLDHVETAVALAAELDRAQEQPGVDQRRDADLGLLPLLTAFRQRGEHGGDLVGLEEIDQAHHHRRRVVQGPRLGEVADRIDHHQARLELADLPVHQRQVHLEAVCGRPPGYETEQTLLDPLMKIDPDGRHVADDLALRLLEREVEAALTPRARLTGEVRRDAALARACGTADEDAAAAVEPLAAQHRVQSRDPRREPLVGRFVTETGGRDGKDREAVLVDQERVLVGSVRRAPILDHAQAPRRHLLGHPVVEQDHAVRHVFFQSLARERPIAALGGDHGGDALVLEPAEQPAQLGT